jgi:hypothetical protein
MKQGLLAAIVIAGTTGLYGCSSDSDDGELTGETITNSGTVQGRITGFGSIYVNGVEYETDNAVIHVDGESATEDDLDLGMIVTLRGEASGARGTAQSVTFDDDVEGIVTSVNLDQKGIGNINVMGYSVQLDANTLVEYYTMDINTLEQAIYDPNVGIQYVAEVSGYSDGQGDIHATRIEIKSYDAINAYLEVKGFVQNHSQMNQTFSIAGMNVTYSNVTQYDDMSPAMLNDGLHVEVKGRSFDAQGFLVAEKIENETLSGIDNSDVNDDLEIEGVVRSLSSDSFVLNGYTIYFDENTTGTEVLSENALVEVDAYIDSQSRLYAYEIDVDELYDDYHNGIEMKGLVQEIDTANGTVRVMDKTIAVTSSTMIRDEYTKMRYFNLSDINWSAGNQYVEVKAYVDSDGNLVASRLIYEGSGSGETEELEGTLSIDGSGANIMGISVEFGSFGVPATGSRVEMTGIYSSGVFYVEDFEAELEGGSSTVL